MLKLTLIDASNPEVEQMLASLGLQVAPATAAALADLAAPGAAQPDVIVIDTRGGGGLPAETTALRRNHPTTGIVLLTATLDPRFLLDAMRAGVNEVVADPVTATELDQALARVAGQTPSAMPADIAVFTGAKGGVGTTTIAANVAASLAALDDTRTTLLIDLHEAGGDVATFFGAEPRFSIFDALENTDRLDRKYFHGLITPAAPNLDLLTAPERPVAASIDPGSLRALLEFVSGVYRHVVVDLPRPNSPSIGSFGRAHRVVLVVDQQLPSVTRATSAIAALRQRFGRDRIMLVVNRADGASDITADDIGRTLDTPIAHVVPDDYRAVIRSINAGRPLVLEHGGALAEAYRGIAADLAGAELRDEHRGLFARLTHNSHGHGR